MSKWRILAVGVGGQGILLFSKVLGEACLRCGLRVTMSEVHGMAQRGGVVESNIVIGYRSPLISQGEADVLVGLEPVETLRAVGRCRPGGVVITSTDPVVPQIVKDGLASYPSLDEPLARLREVFPRVYLFPGEQMAREAGTPRALNMVALGALAGLGMLGIPKGVWLEALRSSVKPRFLEPNILAFERGYQVTAL